MINAVLYSDQIIGENAAIDRALVGMLAPRGSRIGYIPSGPDPHGQFLDLSRAYYAALDLELALVHDLDLAHDRAGLDALLVCDAIHLSGGDTGAFLRRLRRADMIDMLKDWAADGGVLIGASAGSILMTPSIALDGVFSGIAPEEFPDPDALALVPFEFFPHLQDSQAFLPELLRYSRLTPRPIIACTDGDGVIIENGRIDFIGAPLLIADGVARPASSCCPELAQDDRTGAGSPE